MVSLAEATRNAEEAGLDLVEISPNAEPPVCKVMDYGKFLFEKSKAQKEQKKKQKQIQVKEIKFRPGTDEGAHQDIGIDLLNRVKTDLEDIATCESFPRRVEGRQMIMVLAPNKK